ncbi:MAG: hypothetical protein ACYSRR_01185 [Planctomycetota bacterium]
MTDRGNSSFTDYIVLHYRRRLSSLILSYHGENYGRVPILDRKAGQDFMEAILQERKYQLLNREMLSINEFDREKKLVNEAVEIAMNLVEEVKNEK